MTGSTKRPGAFSKRQDAERRAREDAERRAQKRSDALKTAIRAGAIIIGEVIGALIRGRLFMGTGSGRPL